MFCLLIISLFLLYDFSSSLWLSIALEICLSPDYDSLVGKRACVCFDGGILFCIFIAKPIEMKWDEFFAYFGSKAKKMKDYARKIDLSPANEKDLMLILRYANTIN